MPLISGAGGPGSVPDMPGIAWFDRERQAG
jgi:hypothetical protein